MALSTGSRLGPYEVLVKLGEGGMGEVYRARDAQLNRDVAIKILPDVFASDADRVARFTREAQTLASLNHPHIAQIYGLEQTPTTSALVMELVEGEDLAQRIARGPIPLDEALAIARQIAEGLEAAHEKGIIHRDLKPANIKLTANGDVKILDFGLAKAVDAAASIDVGNSPTFTSPAVTGAGVILGTAAYMSPEQARGKPVDRRSDIWALGCVLYELLAGRRAFEGETVSDLIAAVIGREPDWSALPASCPITIRRLLRRCLEKDRQRRLDSAAVARLEIEEALSVQPPDEDHVAPPRRWMSPLLPWAVAAIAIAVGGWQWFTTGPEGPTSAEATPLRFSIPLPAGTRLNLEYPALAVAPDGQSVVAAIFDGVEAKLAIRRADALSLEMIPGTENGSRPFFLPDGRRLVFVRGNRELCVIEATGGMARLIAGVDPRRFAGASSAPDDTIVFANQTDGGLWGLQRVKLSGGPLTTLAVPDAGNGETAFLWPQVLPDNEHVLFTVGHSGERYSVETISLATGARRRVLDDAFGGQYSASGHVAFFRSSSRATNGTVGELMAASFDMKRLAVEGGPASLITGVHSATFNAVPGVNFAVSSNMLTIVPSAQLGVWSVSSLAWVDRQGKAEKVPAVPQPYRHLSLSPEGTRVAAGLQGANRDVWIHDLVRGVPSRFTTAEGEDETPQWSPDGKRLAWSGFRDGKETLLIASADGSSAEERVWTTEKHVHVNGWSPDGQTVYLMVGNNNANRDLWTFSLGERAATPIVQTPAQEFGAAPSPDGRWVAYVSDASGRVEVYVRGVRDAGRTQVSREGGREPVWARDGRELFYRSLDSTKILSVPVGGTTEFQAGAPTVTLNLAFLAGGTDPAYAVSRDGKRFLVILEEKAPEVSAQSIEVTVNWSAGLKP